MSTIRWYQSEAFADSYILLKVQHIDSAAETPGALPDLQISKVIEKRWILAPCCACFGLVAGGHGTPGSTCRAVVGPILAVPLQGQRGWERVPLRVKRGGGMGGGGCRLLLYMMANEGITWLKTCSVRGTAYTLLVRQCDPLLRCVWVTAQFRLADHSSPWPVMGIAGSPTNWVSKPKDFLAWLCFKL